MIRINPFVFIPEKIPATVLREAGKEKGLTPIKGVINKTPYRQTLVRYAGHWRLYINTMVLKDTPKRISKTATIFIEFDHAERKLKMHPDFVKALAKKKKKLLKNFFIPAAGIIRYISNLKTAEIVERTITRAINFLSGNGSFMGRHSLESVYFLAVSPT